VDVWRKRGQFTVTVEHEGEAHHGTYTVTGTGPSAVVRVSHAYGDKATQAGGSGADIVSRILLREIVSQRVG
jgi:hypothetical protein